MRLGNMVDPNYVAVAQIERALVEG